jgi:hypothetical protein
MWARHNNLEKVERPPVLCRPVGAWAQLIPTETILSTDPLYREIEYKLRIRLYKNFIGDDEVIEPYVDISSVQFGEDRIMMWGVNIDVHPSQKQGGAFIFKPEIKDEADIEKLKVPDWYVDEKATQLLFEKASELLDGILDVRIIHSRLDGAHLTYWGAYLRGLEQMMYDCVDRPKWFHRFMQFLSDAHIKHYRGLEADDHIVNNSDNPANGICHICDSLPQPTNKKNLRLTDNWCRGDSQEFTLVSPRQWDEFVLQYQIPIFKL